MKWTKQRLNNLFFVIGIVAVVVMILTFDVSFAELWQHLTHAGYWLIPIIGIWLVVYGLNALAWQSIIRCNSDGERVSPWRIYRLTITGYALNYATPVGGLGGEPYRIVELSKNIGNQRATSSVILYAMMHFFAHFWLWFTSIFLYLALAAIDYVPMTPAIGTLMGAAIVFCLAAFYVFSKGYKHGLVVKLIRWAGKIPGLKGWSTRFQQRHAEALQNIDRQIASLHKQDKRSFYYSLFMEYASRIVQSLEILFMLLLFGIDCGGGMQGLFLTFLYSILILSFTTLLANLIGFLPMQLGVQEGGFMISIALIGMSTKLGSHVDSAALGIFVSIICRFREIIWILIGILLMKLDNIHFGKSRMATVVLLTLTLLTASCRKDNDIEKDLTPWTKGQAERTVMIYMAGENNLTNAQGYRFLQSDFKELIEGSRQLTDKQRLLVFVDSLNNVSSTGTPFIVELHGGEVYPLKQYPEEFYSCDPARFHEVLKTMTDTAPADSYGLVLWGHASGWTVSNDTIAETTAAARGQRRVYGQDDGKDGSLGAARFMNITQMGRALQGLPPLEFIFCDCCNMMCVEVGYELRHATKYLLGSPAEIPGNGAPYNEVLPFFYKNTGSEMYKGIIDTYFEHYKTEYTAYSDLKGYSVPLSVIETQYMDSLAKATYKALPTFVPQHPDNAEVTDKGNVFYWYYDVPMMYDMRGMMRMMLTDEEFRNWDKVYSLAVPYYRTSLRWETIYGMLYRSFDTFLQDESPLGCVSMFVPINSYYYNRSAYRYNETFMNYEWHRQMEWARFGWN